MLKTKVTINLAFLLLFGLFLSCAEEKTEEEINIIGARFVHKFENCDNSDNLEMNCSEFIHFIDADKADVLLGGDDIVFRVDYHRNADQINIVQDNGIHSAVTFRIRDEETLIRNEDNSLWQRK